MPRTWLSFGLLLIIVGLLSQLPRGDSGGMLATQRLTGALQTVQNAIEEDTENEAVQNSDKVLTNIHSVSVNVSDARPSQVSLDVAGEHPDGCEYPVLVDQSREGNIIKIEVYREVPADVFCPMILKPYQGRIELEGSFASGAYTVSVNSHSQTFDI